MVVWFGFGHLGERGRIAACASNLKVLGTGIQCDVNDHDDGLPTAAIDLQNTKLSWDQSLFVCLKPGLARTTGAYEHRQLLMAVRSRFLCPSDPVTRSGFPRSYAMQGRDMTYGWPPTADDMTGVGLFWNSRTVQEILGAEVVPSAMNNPDSLPRLKQSILSDPANTMMLTELCDQNNTLEFVSSTRVFGVNQQQAAFKDDPSQFHFGKFNYLMADGHVELLTRLQTGGIGEAASIWTIKAELTNDQNPVRIR